MESRGVRLHTTRLHTLFKLVPGPLRKVSQAKSNMHFIHKLLPHYHGRIHASTTKPVGSIASQVHYSMSGLQVGRYTRAHVLKIKSHLVQPCVNLDTIRGPLEGLWRVYFYPLVSGSSMTIDSMDTLSLQVHTRVTSDSPRDCGLLVPNANSQAI